MADAAPWIALTASLAFLALSVRILLRIANRPPAPRRRPGIDICVRPELDAPANGNTPYPEVYDDSAHVGGR